MIRLTLLTLAGLVCAMVLWGNEPANTGTATIASEVLPEPDFAEVKPLSASINNAVAITPDVSRRVTIDLTRLRPAHRLQEFEAADAPADAADTVVIPAKATADVPASDSKFLMVTGSRVNLRSGPSTARDVIGRLQRGDKAQFLAEAADGWVQIRDVQSGRVGFMSGDYLTAVN